MPPKKGGAAAGGDEEDVTTEVFFKNYRKNCLSLEIPVNARMKELYEEYVEEGKVISKIHLWDELGWQGTKAIVEALITANYKHTVSIRLWRSKCQDEGARLIANYLIKNKDCGILELLDCAITPLGCEQLNKAFTTKVGGNLQMIKLDHNPLGDDGALILAQGLGFNPDVNLLSLTYCEIGPEGAEGIFEIIIYQNSKMIELGLTGNPLANEGIIKIFQGLAAAKSL
mmetsp:Transcript_7396/g.8930  ORF Transcript_7396/g.8930 Transcript_7396/m.8930 type:complete len:228 (+) Transcript_7396:29-712(+)|eukprot:CAMPEP_0170464284 /NCGR_PEP_ID=MMETSP0123-20130129/9076_1 /TAXON_ID=182087 /ORGANISM="Favella ehrenbergii, Strain Fehren 1" /LENGTH=227 /DNA_ID=CAMNT_0010729923 /DNA_START=8 /DNA_END=691 /DNA_ORIENTATION=+